MNDKRIEGNASGRGVRTRLSRWWLLASATLATVGTFVLSPELRRLVNSPPEYRGYEWLASGLEGAKKAADAAARGSSRSQRRAVSFSLERAIEHSRANARRLGTQPMPIKIRRALAPYFPSEVLDKVRWTLAKPQIDLGTIVAAWYGSEGGAVTLGETIVYSDATTSANVVLWAHELTHVLQYEQLGISEFAKVYVADHRLVEQQARSNTERIRAALARNSDVYSIDRQAEEVPPYDRDATDSKTKPVEGLRDSVTRASAA